MSGNRTINQYFEEITKDPECKISNKITGLKYSFSNKPRKNQILRFLMDDNLDASISKINSKESYLFKYIENSDLLIIGFCLEGKKTINYKGKNTIKKGQVFYLRPRQDFNIKLSGHSFLYYFLDLNYFQDSLSCKGQGGKNNKLYCNSKIDYICKKGEINIEKAPYIMTSYIDEIKKIKDMETDSFLDYTIIKGQLFTYLTWLIKLRLSKNPVLHKPRCGMCCVTRAKKIIIDNLENQITVSQIAEKLDISIYKLQKAFKKVEDTTVYNYIRKAKIDNSKILLKELDLSILDIAQKVGYENPSKFSTAFKNITGYTPTQYRELMGD